MLHQQPSTDNASFGLSAEDVRRLLVDNSPEVRIDMTNKIASGFTGSRFSQQEMMAAEQVFRLLLRDTEVRVREALAENVKASPQLSHDIALTLAKDVEAVSLPLLQYSEVLSDDDLMELMSSTQENSRFLAVSQRKTVSPGLSDLLLEKGDDKVATSLVHNGGAQISDSGFARIIGAYRDNKSLMQAVQERPRLPAAAAEKLVHIVSATLAESLTKKHALSEGQITQEVEKVREGETLNLVRQSRSQEEVERLIAQLVAYNRLTPSIILSALCQGNFAFFETSLARLSNISVANARTLISDRGELGFRAIYNKSGLPDAMFPAVKLLLRVVREMDAEGQKPGVPQYANRLVEHILQYSEETPIENLSYIIALVRRIAE